MARIVPVRPRACKRARPVLTAEARDISPANVRARLAKGRAQERNEQEERTGAKASGEEQEARTGAREERTEKESGVERPVALRRQEQENGMPGMKARGRRRRFQTHGDLKGNGQAMMVQVRGLHPAKPQQTAPSSQDPSKHNKVVVPRKEPQE